MPEPAAFPFQTCHFWPDLPSSHCSVLSCSTTYTRPTCSGEHSEVCWKRWEGFVCLAGVLAIYGCFFSKPDRLSHKWGRAWGPPQDARLQGAQDWPRTPPSLWRWQSVTSWLSQKEAVLLLCVHIPPPGRHRGRGEMRLPLHLQHWRSLLWVLSEGGDMSCFPYLPLLQGRISLPWGCKWAESWHHCPRALGRTLGLCW